MPRENYNRADRFHIEFMVLNLNELLMQWAILHYDDRDEASGHRGVLRGC